jgi:hypothetical protein
MRAAAQSSADAISASLLIVFMLRAVPAEAAAMRSLARATSVRRASSNRCVSVFFLERIQGPLLALR